MIKTVVKTLYIYFLVLALSTPVLGIHGISINVFPSQVTSGGTVHVYGYVDGDITQATRVYIYIDNNLVKSVAPDENGYYATTLTIKEEGLHTIKTRIYGKTAEATVRVVPPRGEKTTSIEIVESKEPEFSFVTVDVSVNTLDVETYGGNVVLVTVTNNLGRRELFEVRTTFPQEMFFAPHQEILENGETKVFPIYFNPQTDPGVYEGFVVVQAGDEVVFTKKIRISVLASQTKEEPIKNGLGFINPSWGFVGVASAIVLFVVLLSIVREEGTREPIKMPEARTPPFQPMEKRERNKRIENSLSKLKRTVEDAKTNVVVDKYVVPWDHVKV